MGTSTTSEEPTVVVSRAQVAAARLLLDRGRARGLPVDPALDAIAHAEPYEPTYAESIAQLVVKERAGSIGAVGSATADEAAAGITRLFRVA